MTALVHEVGSTEGMLRVVYCGFPDRATAERVGDRVLALRLAACVNSFEVASKYHWKGKVEAANETVALFKTSPRKVGALFEYLSRTHPYEVPDIFEIPTIRAHRPYLEYLAETLERGLPVPPEAVATARGLKRSGAPRGPGARSLGRTRGRRRPP